MLNTMPGPIDELADASVSTRIRARLTDAAQAFRANDNIAAFIEDGELDELRIEVENRMKEVLDTLVIDTDNDHNTIGTARRVAKMFIDEVFAGRYQSAPPVTSFCQRVTPQRVDDRWPAYRSQCLLAPSLPHRGKDLDRCLAKRRSGTDWSVEIRASL